MDFSTMSLEDIGEALEGGSLTANEVANALYEYKYRASMMEYCAKGGDRPTHQPPNP